MDNSIIKYSLIIFVLSNIGGIIDVSSHNSSSLIFLIIILIVFGAYLFWNKTRSKKNNLTERKNDTINDKSEKFESIDTDFNSSIENSSQGEHQSSPVVAVVNKLAVNKPIINHADEILQDCIVIDTETTGLNTHTAKVIQLSALKFKNGRVVDTYNRLINPGKENLPLSKDIEYRTGIKSSDLENKPQLSDIKNEFKNFVGNYIWVGHNITGYDIPILINNGLDIKAFTVIDTLPLSRRKLKNRVKNHELETLKRYYGLQFRSHNALEDCKINLAVYKNLVTDNLDQVIIKKVKSLEGLRICITGQFMEATRDDIKAFIQDHGGKCTNTVSHKTNYLVKGTQTAKNLTDGIHSANELKAIEFGTKTIDYAGLIKLAQDNQQKS